jgi:hypothetical protein
MIHHRWVHAGGSSGLSEDGRIVQKQESSPEFCVALSGPLDAGGKQEIEAYYSGDCTYFGIGVCVSLSNVD